MVDAVCGYVDFSGRSVAISGPMGEAGTDIYIHTRP